jgi:hypothetical protein
MGQLTVGGRLVKVGPSMGIDFKKFYDAANLEEVQKKEKSWKGVWEIPKLSFRSTDKITLRASSTVYRALKPCWRRTGMARQGNVDHAGCSFPNRHRGL